MKLLLKRSCSVWIFRFFALRVGNYVYFVPLGSLAYK